MDVDRLISATDSNSVKDLKKDPAGLGILGTSIDGRILHMDMVTILAVARAYGDQQLHDLMRAEGMSLTATAGTTAAERLGTSELGRMLRNNSLGTRKVGQKPGGGTKAAFNSLAKIARTNDGAINRAIGEGLQQIVLIDSFEVERDLGTGLTFYSDLYLVRAGEPIRVEVMWRTQTSRAAIANYVLGKLRNYGRAIGYLNTS